VSLLAAAATSFVGSAPVLAAYPQGDFFEFAEPPRLDPPPDPSAKAGLPTLIMATMPMPAPAPAAPADNAAIASIVTGAVRGLAGEFGIAVRNLKTSQTFVVGDDFYPSASLYKLAVMYEVFRQQATAGLDFGQQLTISTAEAGESTDDDPLGAGDQLTIQKALQLMIDVSSNAAGHALADRVGWDQINQSMASLGLNHTRLPAPAWQAQVSDWRHDTASTSPGDMLAFFDLLYHRQLVSPTASDQMTQILLGQQINDRIPADLPAGTRVAHKTGDLDNVINDAGIVYGPQADFILAILSRDADAGNAASAEASLARALFDHFNKTG
jgi:beta-lactamase class A